MAVRRRDIQYRGRTRIGTRFGTVAGPYRFEAALDLALGKQNDLAPVPSLFPFFPLVNKQNQ
jgi:hypothetical protein